MTIADAVLACAAGAVGAAVVQVASGSLAARAREEMRTALHGARLHAIDDGGYRLDLSREEKK